MVSYAILQSAERPISKDAVVINNLTPQMKDFVLYIIDSTFLNDETVPFKIDTGVSIPVNQIDFIPETLLDVIPLEINKKIVQIASNLSFSRSENFGEGFAFRKLYKPNVEESHNEFKYELIHNDISVKFFPEDLKVQALYDQVLEASRGTNGNLLFTTESVMGRINRRYRASIFKEIITRIPLLSKARIFDGINTDIVYVFDKNNECMGAEVYSEIIDAFYIELDGYTNAGIFPAETSEIDISRLSLQTLPSGQYRVSLEAMDAQRGSIDVYADRFDESVIVKSLPVLFGKLLEMFSEHPDSRRTITITSGEGVTSANETTVTISTGRLNEFVFFTVLFDDDTDPKVSVTREISPSRDSISGMEMNGAPFVMYTDHAIGQKVILYQS